MIKEHWLKILLILILSYISKASQMYLPIVIKNIIDDPTLYNCLINLILGIALCLVMSYFNYEYDTRKFKLMINILIPLRDKGYEHCLNLLEKIDYNKVYRYINDDIFDCAHNILSMIFNYTSSILSLITGYIITYYYLGSTYANIILITSFVISLFDSVGFKILYDIYDKFCVTRDNYYEKFYNHLHTIDDIVMSANENIARKNFHDLQIQYQNTNFKFRKYEQIFNNANCSLSEFSAIASILMCIYLLYNSAIEFSKLYLVVIYIAYIANPIVRLMDQLPEITKTFVAYKRCKVIDNLPEMRKDGIDFNDKVHKISFKGQYKVNDEFMLDTKFIAHKNEKVALVGPSGSGKSTIIKLLMALKFSDRGKCYINDVCYDRYSLQSLRKKFAIVPQTPTIIKGTLKDNLLLTAPESSDSELICALKNSGLENFKLDMQIENLGSNLSGGEKQRISIARCFLNKNAEIIILDEATSSLDNIIENSIMENLDKLGKDKITIVIAHRLSTIINADRICYICDGKITEEGTFEELMNIDNGGFKALYKSIK